MGTRADFYIQKESGLEWLGAIGWDGYDVTWKGQPKGKGIADATTDEEFLAAVAAFAESRSKPYNDKGDTTNDWTSQEDGWPWPWENSHLTDYSYVFNGKSVDVYNWAVPVGGYEDYYKEEERCEKAEIEFTMAEPEKSDIFPNMKDKQKSVPMDERSGIIILHVPVE